MLAMLQASGLDYAYLVSGNLYGPRDTFDPVNGHVLPSLIHKFYEASLDTRPWQDASPVTIWGDGATTRDFLYSEDLADIVSFMLGNKFTGAINTGSGQTASIEYIAKRLCSISGVDYARVQYDTTKPKGRPNCFADLSKLHDLGWSAPTFLGDGLKKTYDWYAQSRKVSPG